MKEIILNTGRRCKVDDVYFPLLNCHNWTEKEDGYAMTRIAGKLLTMHRYILGNPPALVDHINHDKLDNQLANLRLCSFRENQFNRLPNKDKKYKGVQKQKNGRYRVVLRVNGKLKHVGMFDNEIDAARAYNLAAMQRSSINSLNNIN